MFALMTGNFAGSVMLHVTRQEDSASPGQLLFSIRDSGEGMPPRGRHSLLLARAWDFAAECGGTMKMSSGARGMEVCLGLDFEAAEAEGSASAREKDGTILVAAREGGKRHVLAWQLKGLGHAVREARSAEEAMDACREQRARLIVLHGDLGEEEILRCHEAVRGMAGETALLLLSEDEGQAERLKELEHLPYPASRKDVRRMARWLLSSRESARPVLSGERITVADVLAGARSGSEGISIKTGVPKEKGGREEPAATEAPEEKPQAGEEESGLLLLHEEAAASPDAGDGGLLSLGGPAPEKTGGGRADSAPGGALSIDLGDQDDAMPIRAEEEPVVELTEADMVAGGKDGQAAEAGDAQLEGRRQGNEEMEDPQQRLLSGARALEKALHEGRRMNAAQISLRLARLAETYDLRTISDMAHCICAACGEGDMDSASQTCMELFCELERK